MTTGSALPTLPQIRSTRAVDFVASLVRFRYSLPGCLPPCTDQTGILPQPPGTFTSRLSTDWSPSPLLDITTTATGLFCWRDSHPLEWQLASLHGHFQPAQGQQRVRPFPLCPESDRQPSQRRMARRANALNRCAIARCAGSPTACTATGVEIVDSVRVVLS